MELLPSLSPCVRTRSPHQRKAPSAFVSPCWGEGLRGLEGWGSAPSISSGAHAKRDQRKPTTLRCSASSEPRHVALAAAAPAVAPPKMQQETLTPPPPSLEYNHLMRRHMANPYEYHHELGMYYTRITASILVGSQPQAPADVDTLVSAEGASVILNLQEGKDSAYWGIDSVGIQRHAEGLGVEYHRKPAVDFDPHSLRRSLPAMVAVIAGAVARGETVYVHCTAGLGRSPAAVIAYLFWFSEPRGNLQRAYDTLTALRPCGPKWDAIRGATYDLAKNSPYQPAFDHLPDFAFNDVADWERDLIRERVLRCA